MLLAQVMTILRSDSMGTVYAASGIQTAVLPLIRIETAKLAQAGFEDTSWQTLV